MGGLLHTHLLGEPHKFCSTFQQAQANGIHVVQQLCFLSSRLTRHAVSESGWHSDLVLPLVIHF